MPPNIDRLLYVGRVLALYRLMPGTAGHIRRSDRQLAGSFHDRGISLDLLRAAMLIVAARRTFRSGQPLAPIASLHYIQPVVEELLAQPADPDYIRFVCRKLAPIAPDFITASAHQLP